MRWIRRAGELEWHGRATRIRIDGALGPVVGMITAQTHRIWGRTEPIAKAYLCETLLDWLSFSHAHSFCNCNLKHLVFFSTLSCFVFAISGGIFSLFVSLKLSLTAFSFSIVGFQKYRRRQTPGGGWRFGGGIAGSAAPQPY